MARWRSLVAFVVVGLVLAGCARLTVDQGPSHRYDEKLSQDCSEAYIVVFARGSSQPREPSGQPETRRFFAAMDEVFRKQIRLGYVSVEYPAKGGHDQNWEAYRNGATAGGYHDSRLAGSKSAADFLNRRTAQCEAAEKGTDATQRQRYILGGYSQGAHAMREALFLLDKGTRERVSHVALFGDPTFKESSIAAGQTQKGAEGIFGGRAPQVPKDLVVPSQSYCDRDDFFCNGGTRLVDLARGQAKDLLKRAVGQLSEHALYPKKEMYEAAAENLKRRQLPGFLPRLDLDTGRFAGRYGGTAGCGWSGEVGSSDPKHLVHLLLEVRTEGTRQTATETVDRLTAVLTYEETNEGKRKRLGQAQLKGTGTEGRVDLRHVGWISEAEGLKPIDIVAEATQTLTGEGTVESAPKITSLQTPLSGHQGCFYRLSDPPSPLTDQGG